MRATVTRGLRKSREFGSISRIDLPDKSRIYISKLGWTLVTPQGGEVCLPWVEIALAVEESARRGYVVK